MNCFRAKTNIRHLQMKMIKSWKVISTPLMMSKNLNTRLIFKFLKISTFANDGKKEGWNLNSGKLDLLQKEKSCRSSAKVQTNRLSEWANAYWRTNFEIAALKAKSLFKKGGYLLETSPEAQRTQGIESITWEYLCS